MSSGPRYGTCAVAGRSACPTGSTRSLSSGCAICRGHWSGGWHGTLGDASDVMKALRVRMGVNSKLTAGLDRRKGVEGDRLINMSERDDLRKLIQDLAIV